MATTIRDVAARAGVGTTTVTRVLNGERSVSAGSRQRVLDAVEALFYRPNIFARGLSGNRSFLICLLIPEVIPGYVTEFQLGAIERCRAAGYHLVAQPYDSREPHYAEAVREAIGALRPDGFIITPPISDDLGVLGVLEAAGTPYVRLSPGLELERGNSISIDELEAARQMTELLIEAGHRRIGFVRAHPDHVAAGGRFDGYRRALTEHDLPYDEGLVRQGNFEFSGGEACGTSLLTQVERPTAIFASNDDTALGVMAAAYRLGLRVPQDLSLVGFDDSDVARHAWPLLTTVRQPIRQMAAMAAEFLIARDQTGTARCKVQFEIVQRGTVTGNVSKSPALGMGDIALAGRD